MRALVQRVRSASVTIDNRLHAGIGQGLLILLGAGQTDDEAIAAEMARKIANLRIFQDSQGKMNLSIQDVQGEALVVSQFTLYADTSRGNRPSFIRAGAPHKASPLVDFFATRLEELGVPVKKGVFGADMLVSLENDGPVTIWLENEKQLTL